MATTSNQQGKTNKTNPTEPNTAFETASEDVESSDIPDEGWFTTELTRGGQALSAAPVTLTTGGVNGGNKTGEKQEALDVEKYFQKETSNNPASTTRGFSSKNPTSGAAALPPNGAQTQKSKFLKTIKVDEGDGGGLTRRPSQSTPSNNGGRNPGWGGAAASAASSASSTSKVNLLQNNTSFQSGGAARLSSSATTPGGGGNYAALWEATTSSGQEEDEDHGYSPGSRRMKGGTKGRNYVDKTDSKGEASTSSSTKTATEGATTRTASSSSSTSNPAVGASANGGTTTQKDTTHALDETTDLDVHNPASSSSSTTAASSTATTQLGQQQDGSSPGGVRQSHRPKTFYNARGEADWSEDLTKNGMEPRYDTSSKYTGGNNIWLHIYDIDGFTQWLNESFLINNDWGAYHAGVEVYGDEWSFLFYNDVLDPTVTGCNRVYPRRHPDFSYRSSVYMGRTPLKAMEVSRLLLVMMENWPSVKYHITDRNCVDFAFALCKQLQVPRPFPQWVRGGLHLARNNGTVKNVVDSVWGVVKWWNQVDEENAYVPPPNATAQGYIESTTGISADLGSATSNGSMGSSGAGRVSEYRKLQEAKEAGTGVQQDEYSEMRPLGAASSNNNSNNEKLSGKSLPPLTAAGPPAKNKVATVPAKNTSAPMSMSSSFSPPARPPGVPRSPSAGNNSSMNTNTSPNNNGSRATPPSSLSVRNSNVRRPPEELGEPISTSSIHDPELDLVLIRDDHDGVESG